MISKTIRRKEFKQDLAISYGFVFIAGFVIFLAYCLISEIAKVIFTVPATTLLGFSIIALFAITVPLIRSYYKFKVD